MDKGATLLFVHGWATDGRVWEGVAGDIADGKRILNINLPGHGGAFKWDAPSLAPALLEIERAASDCPTGALIGVGWSLGAEALIASVSEAPERFKALVLVGATPSFTAKDDFPHAQPRALVKRMIIDMKKDPQAALNRFYCLNFTEEELDSKEADEFMWRYRYPGPIECEVRPGRIPGCYPAFNYVEITTALEALYKTDLRERLDALKIPALVIHGALDSVTPVDAGRCLASGIKGAAIDVFEKAGHAPFITEKERFKRTVRDFIAAL